MYNEMNSIKAEIDKSEYGYDDFLNYRIDDFWLDEKLDSMYPGNWYGGTIPTLTFGMEIKKEEEIVWERFLPSDGQKTNCPILMCPDDNDFSCTIIIADIENSKHSIKWNKIGIDVTTDLDPTKIGSKVDWFDKIEQFEFAKSDYIEMINRFKKGFELDKLKWLRKSREQKTK